MLTEQQEAKLLKLLEAYEHGKKVSDLPEVEGEDVSSGLMVEVLQDGESRKFDLGKVSPEKKTLAISEPKAATSGSGYPAYTTCAIAGAVDAEGYRPGDEIVIGNPDVNDDGTPALDEGGNPVVKEISRETILTSSLNADGSGSIVAATPTGGIATYICGDAGVMRYTSCEPAFTIVSVNKYVGLTDANGSPIYTEYKDPHGIPVLDEDGNEIPVLDEDGNEIPVLDDDGATIFDDDGNAVIETLRQKSQYVDAYIPVEEYDVKNISAGQLVSIKYANKTEVGIWHIGSSGSGRFSVCRGCAAEQKYLMGAIINTSEYGRIVYLDNYDIPQNLYLVYSLEGSGLQKKDLPYGDLRDGRYSFSFPESSFALPAFGTVERWGDTKGFINAVDEIPAAESQIYVAAGIERREDGFWYLSRPVDSGIYSSVPRYNGIRDMTFDFNSGESVLSSDVNGEFTNMLLGLLSPNASGLHNVMQDNNEVRFLIVGEEGVSSGYMIEFIRGGAVRADILEASGYDWSRPVYIVEFWVFHTSDFAKRKFVRLAYYSDNTPLIDYCIIPESLE